MGSGASLPTHIKGPFVASTLPTSAAGSASSSSAACDPAPSCRFGANCYNRSATHRGQFWHPPEEEGRVSRYRACKYGATCRDQSLAHLQEFTHPGDRSYKWNAVVFPPGLDPQFETLWQLFSYVDQDESGHLAFEAFTQALRLRLKSPDEGLLHNCWCDAGGEAHGTVNFARFAAWAEAFPLNLPVGLNGAGANRPCNFEVMNNDGSSFRCACADYCGAAGSVLCECGHKLSLHRSTAALCMFSEFADEVPWDSDGLALVDDWEVLKTLQHMLHTTHKESDNWTRDRGCKLHGVNGPGCSLKCAFQNRVAVPTGYVLRKVYRNQNKQLWSKYCLAKSTISEECKREPCAQSRLIGAELCEVGSCGLGSIDSVCNEWRLYHGTSLNAGKDICAVNFRPALAGTGATWKDDGEAKGVPLYGFGIYFAERITKADEYAKPVFDAELGAEVYAMLVVRIVGGRTNVVTSNDINPDNLREAIFDGPYHSVIGDRMSTLKKPYREAVIYDRDQCFPEFLMLYERV